MIRYGILVSFFLWTQISQARVFNMSANKLGSYLFVNYGTQGPKDSLWAQESSATTSSKNFGAMTGGEFGLTYMTKRVAWRFGFEVFKPAKLSEILAQNGSTDLYSITSDVTGYAPKVGLEIIPWMTNTQKMYVFAYAGSASFTVKNDYTNVTIAPNADHSLEMIGSGSLTGGGLGYEALFFDTTTFVFEVGMRSLKISQFKAKTAVTTFNGSLAAGDPILKTDGTNRDLNLSGAYVTVGLRFWIF